MREWTKKSRGFFTFMKTKGRIWLLLGGALLGVLLLLFGGMSGTVKEEVDTPDTMVDRVAELQAYEARLEKELEVVCEAVAGVGETEVMVSFESGYTVQYQKNGDNDPATVGTGSNEDALFHTLLPPAVAGVGIVCRGGNDPTVRETLTELISTTLGIPSNRVYITGK